MKNFIVSSVVCICLFLFAASSAFAQPAAKAIVDRECARCHSLKKVYKANKSAADWETTVNRMIKKGAAVKPRERDAVLKYLRTLDK